MLPFNCTRDRDSAKYKVVPKKKFRPDRSVAAARANLRKGSIDVIEIEPLHCYLHSSPEAYISGAISISESTSCTSMSTSELEIETSGDAHVR